MFDWDQYAANATWNEIRSKSPFLRYQRLPSLLHQEKGLVYLSSVDIALSLSDVDGLQHIIIDIKSAFDSYLNKKNYYKAAIAASDFQTVKDLLLDLGIENSDSI